MKMLRQLCFNVHGMIDVVDEKNINNVIGLLTPFKPIPFKGWYGKCKCGVVFLDNTTKYCGNCGQRLDWGEQNER